MKLMAAILLLASLGFVLWGAVKAQRGEILSIVDFLLAIWLALMVLVAKFVLVGWLFQ